MHFIMHFIFNLLISSQIQFCKTYLTNRIRLLPKLDSFTVALLEVFQTPEGGISGIFLLLKYEIQLEIVASATSFNSVSL